MAKKVRKSKAEAVYGRFLKDEARISQLVEHVTASLESHSVWMAQTLAPATFTRNDMQELSDLIFTGYCEKDMFRALTQLQKQH